MRGLFLAAALAGTVSAGAQGMWDALAASDYRVDAAGAGTLRLEIENLDFFRDNEYASALTKGYSLPGLLLTPKLTYMPHRRVSLELGCHALVFNGANKYPCYAYHDIGTWKGSQYQRGAHVLPWLRASLQFSRLTVVMGDIYGGQNHGFVTPLFNTETNLSQDPEMGVQLLWDRKHIHMDTWINWQSYIFDLDTHQEAFTVGSNWTVLFNSPGSRLHWYMPVQLAVQHRGGEQDVTDMGVQTLCNAALGAGVRWNAGRRALTALGGEAQFLASYQESGELWPFDGGCAVHAAASAQLFRCVGFKVGALHAPDNFVSLYGNPLFSTLSVADGLCRPGMTTAYLRADYTYRFMKECALGVEAEAFAGRVGGASEQNFSFGIYFRVNPSFVLCRKRHAD